MNKQYLEEFTEEQLENYLLTVKNRVKDMRDLNLDLGQENKELAKEYNALVEEKKVLSGQLRKHEKSWSNWFQQGTQTATGLMKITTRFSSPKNEYTIKHEQKVEEMPSTPEKEKKSRQLKEEHEKENGSSFKDKLAHFNFDGVFVAGKEKMGEFVDGSKKRFSDLKEIVKGAYNKHSGKKKDEQQQEEEKKRDGYQPMEESDYTPPGHLKLQEQKKQRVKQHSKAEKADSSK